MAYIPCGAFFSTARSLVPNDSSSICDASRAPAKTFLGSQLRKQMEKSSESTVDRTIKMDYVGLRGKIYHHHWEHPMYNGNTGEVAWWRPDVQDQFPDLATTAEWRNSGNIFDQQNYPHKSWYYRWRYHYDPRIDSYWGCDEGYGPYGDWNGPYFAGRGAVGDTDNYAYRRPVSRFHYYK
mmetsp:Transcript_40787/g.66146  ORF Transcript_40787/g.66146 Transcript_40787/m.66146 type:complete len:180 (-) Transcript_40787:223-762(-)